MKFTLKQRGLELEVRPDYHDGGRENGPVGWMRQVGATEPTGVALAVGGYTRTAREHSLSWTDLRDEIITDCAIDGATVDKAAWEEAFLKACDETL